MIRARTLLRKLHLLLLASSVVGCASCNPFDRDNEQTIVTGDYEDLDEKLEVYCEKSYELRKDVGYYGGKCDSLLFTSLHAIACPNVSIKPFFTPEGRPFRSPTHDCFNNGAKTSVSRDMIMGFLLYAWHHKDVEQLGKLIEYARSHAWALCENDYATVEDRIGRCQVTPQLKSLMYAVYQAIGGECDQDCKDSSVISPAAFPGTKGYQAHLATLSILIWGSVHGAIDDIHRDVLKAYAEREPRNALYNAVYSLFTDGDMGEARKSLRDESLFPGKELPTSANYCTDYLFQRDIMKEKKVDGKVETYPNPDWLPCPKEGHTHSGTDFIFAAAVANGKLRYWTDQ